MKFLWLILLVLTIFFNSVSAQEFSSNAYSEALSGAVSCLSGIYASRGNPAGNISENFSASISYFDRYQLKEVSQKSAAVLIPCFNGCFGADFNYLGFKLFNQIQGGINYAMKLSEKISGGIKINYHNLHIDNSAEKFYAVSAEVGIIVCPMDNFLIATFVANPTNSQFNSVDTVLMSKIQIGMMYKFCSSGFVCLDFEKQSIFDNVDVRFSAASYLNKYLEIQGGFSTFPFNVSLGFGVKIENLRMQFSTKRDNYLGFMPSVTLCWGE